MSKQTERDSPWINMAENGVRELKKSSRQMLLKHSPKRLWDVSGETAGISEYAEYGLYDWVQV